MTLSADQYVLPYRTADGQVVPLVFQRNPENGRLAVPVRSADGQIMVAGLGPLNATDQYGIPTLSADGQVAGMRGGPVGGDLVLVGGTLAFGDLHLYAARWVPGTSNWVEFGGSWSTSDVTAGQIYDAQSVGNLLYVGGSFISPDFPASYLMAWDGTGWVDVGYPGDVVRDIAIWGNSIVVTDWPNRPEPSPADRVWVFDGSTWAELPVNINWIYSTVEYGGQLYGCGDNQGSETEEGSVFVFSGSDWTTAGSETVIVANPLGGNTVMRKMRLASWGGDLFVFRGYYRPFTSFPRVVDIIRLTGGAWQHLGQTSTSFGSDNSVLSRVYSGSSMFMAGNVLLYSPLGTIRAFANTPPTFWPAVAPNDNGGNDVIEFGGSLFSFGTQVVELVAGQWVLRGPTSPNPPGFFNTLRLVEHAVAA